VPDTANQIAGAVAYTFPNASDQLSAALSAPIPFFVAIFAVAIGIWGIVWKAFDWRYAGIIEQTKSMLELARAENESFKNKYSESEATIKSLQNKIDGLTKIGARERDFKKSAQEDVDKLLEQMHGLRQSTDVISESLSRVPSTFQTYAPLLSHKDHPGVFNVRIPNQTDKPDITHKSE
jgi:hypothetical protein